MRKALEPLSSIDSKPTVKATVSESEESAVRKFSYKFDKIELVTGTDPIALFIMGKEYPLGRKWTNLPVKVCIALEAMWPGKVRELVAAGNISFMAMTARGMRRGQYIPEAKVWVEKNCAAREFVRQTRNLCRLFDINLTDVSVTYVAKGAKIDEEPVASVDAGEAAKSNEVPISPAPEAQAVHDYVAQHPGCTKQQAIDELSDMGVSKVLTRLDRHPEVIEVERRLYVKESIEGFDEAAETLREALDSLFAANGGYTSAHELYQTVQLKLDDFFYDNDAFESEGEIFDIAAYLFGKAGYKGRHHIFRGGTHIWREQPDYPEADHGLLIHWARLNGGVLTRQIGYDNLERRGALGSGKPAIFSQAMKKVKDKFWVLSDNEFLLKDGIEISAEFLADVKRSLDELLILEEQEDGVSFIPMGVVGDDFFASLPTLPGNRSWSIQLLQAVIADHCVELHYKTIARSSSTGQSHAAIVPDGCECQDFSDLVYAVIKARNNKPSISFGRVQFVEFLKSAGLYPEDMQGQGSSIENMLGKNGHFKWLGKNNLMVS